MENFPATPITETEEIDRTAALREILADPDSTGALEDFCLSWEESMRSASRDCTRIQAFDSSLAYLIDFDVLLQYLQAATSDAYDTVAIDFIFNSSNRNYALPIGAFQELIDWLTKLGALAESLGEASGSTDVKKILVLLQDELSFTGRGDRSLGAEPSIRRSLTNFRESSTLAFERLAGFLTSPRFLGLVDDYSLEDEALLFQALTGSRRGDEGTRTRRDQRDARNLACSLMSIRNYLTASGGENTQGCPFFLVTRTRAVLNMVHQIEDHLDENRKLVSKLAAAVGMEPNCGKNRLERRYPVLTPARATVIEKLGAFEDAEISSDKARLYREDFSKLADQLENYNATLSRARRLDTSLSSAVMHFIELHKGRILGELAKIIDRMWGTGNPLNVLERFRATSISTDSNRRMLWGSQVSDIKDVSSQFLRLLSRVSYLMSDMKGYEYSFSVEQDSEAKNLRWFRVSQGRFGEIMDGEEYSHPDGTPAYFVLRWRTACTPRRFFDGLAAAMPSSDRMDALGSDRFELLRPDEETLTYSNAVLVCSDRGTFAQPLGLNLPADQPGSAATKHWTVGLAVRLSQQLLPASEHKSGGIEIRQFRANTPAGDFLLDVAPPIDDENLHCTVISEFNVAKTILPLAHLTALEGVFHEKLGSQLHTFLAHFPDPEGSK